MKSVTLKNKKTGKTVKLVKKSTKLKKQPPWLRNKA